MRTLKIQDMRKPCPQTSQEAGTPRNQLVQHEKSFAPVSMKKNKATSKQCATTSPWTDDSSMAVSTQQTDGNSMAVGMQWMGVNPRAVGAQWTGGNPRAETAHSYP